MIARVALTGGIGAGKSTVCRLFSSLGVPVLDADLIARELVAPEMPAFAAIHQEFGDRVLAPDGTLDRARLREIIFADPERRRRLEAVLHPRVYAELERLARGLTGPYAVFCIPLLVESGQASLFDRIIVVDAPVATQLKRITERDHLTAREAEAIIRIQASREQRLALADFVVINDSGLDTLEQQVLEVHRRCLEGLTSAG